MKFNFLRTILTILFIWLPSISRAEESRGPYLFEQLLKPDYSKTFNMLFKGQRNIEPWLKGYIKNRNGVDIPSETRFIGAKNYEFYEICKPHDCPGNVLYVMFEPGGTHAWALFTKDDNTSRFFGNPSLETKKALTSTDSYRLFHGGRQEDCERIHH